MAENLRPYFHYCSLAKFVSIIRNKTLRLSNLFFMNDYQELSWFFDIARRRLEEHLEQPGNFQDNDAECDNEALMQLHSLLDSRRFDHIYAACFSEKKDDLSQWRGYADDGRGVTLGVDLWELTEQSNCKTLELMNVTYDAPNALIGNLLEPMLCDESSESFESSSSSSSGGLPLAIRVFREMSRWAPAYKNPAFEAEEEWRLVVRTKVPPESELPPDEWSEMWFEGFPSEVEFHDAGPRLVPFTRVELPMNLVRSVGMGPRFGTLEDEAALKLFTRKHLRGESIDFYRSTASYR